VASADAPRQDRSSDLPVARPPVLPDGPVTVGSLLRREGRAAHSQDRPVVPRARDVVTDRGPAHRAAVTAGTVLAVAAVLGTNVIGGAALGPGTGDDDERGFGGPVVPDPPSPLSLAATAAPVGHAMAVLRAAGSPVLAAMNDLTGGRPASGAGIVAQALAGFPGLTPATVVPAATVSDDDGDGSAAETSDGSDTRASTSTSTSTSKADDTSSTRRSSARSTTARRSDRSGGTASTPVRIPPVLSGLGPAGPGPAGPGGGVVAPPTTPVVPAPSTRPDPAPDGPTGVTPNDGGAGSTPAVTGDGGNTAGDEDGGGPATTDGRTDDAGSGDSPKTDSPKTDAPPTGSTTAASTTAGSTTTAALADSSGSAKASADDSVGDTTATKDSDGSSSDDAVTKSDDAKSGDSDGSKSDSSKSDDTDSDGGTDSSSA
jgi:hypothetical protein